MTGSGKCVLLVLPLFFTVTAPAAYGQDLFLRVEIKTMQTTVNNARDFDITTKIENIGKEEQFLHLSQCSYSSLQWAADNPSVHVKQIFCKKNRLIDIRLKPDETYERALPVYIEIPVLGIPQAVTFRLGFSPRDETILVGPHPIPLQPLAPVRPIWSNALTVNVGK
jgi:hypothetical protein